MKRSLSILICLLVTMKLFAQDCSQFIYMQKGKTIEMTSYNQGGEVIRKVVNHISDVSTAGGTTTATVSSQSFDRNGQSKGKKDVLYRCTGGVFSIDLNANTPQVSRATMNTSYMEYPAGMKVGDHFKDIETKMQITMGSRTMNVTEKITDRQVVAKESITTPAGTWQALKITYNIITTLEGDAHIPPDTTQTTQWYVPNFGIVQFMIGGGMTVKITAIH